MSALLAAFVLTVPAAPPQIDYFWAGVDPYSVLTVYAHVSDEDPGTATVDIDWLDTIYTVGVTDYGYVYWATTLHPGEEGWISAIAYDSEGLSSDKVEDLIIPY
jgi:hypothetical protein